MQLYDDFWCKIYRTLCELPADACDDVFLFYFDFDFKVRGAKKKKFLASLEVFETS